MAANVGALRRLSEVDRRLRRQILIEYRSYLAVMTSASDEDVPREYREWLRSVASERRGMVNLLVFLATGKWA